MSNFIAILKPILALLAKLFKKQPSVIVEIPVLVPKQEQVTPVLPLPKPFKITQTELSAELISKATGARIDRAQRFAQYLSEGMDLYGINTPVRQAAFLAQIGHESGGLKYTSELWGPTPAQTRYEGRIDLGNTVTGDGSKFRGHGLIQTTGRSNHRRATVRLRKRFGASVPDFEEFPLALAETRWAVLSACDFWDDNKLNSIADLGDFEKLTRKINGGLNGLADRQALYASALKVFA